MSKVWSECKYSVRKLSSRIDYQIMLISCVQKSAKYKGRIHECVPVKSGSTPVGGPVKSGRKRTRDKGRGLDKRLVRPELVTAWIQRLRTTSVDPLRRFRSRRGDGDRDRDGQDQE